MRRMTKIVIAAAVALGAAATHRYVPALDARIPIDAGIDGVLDVPATAGLKFNKLMVEGRAQTAPDDIIAAVDIEQGAPILSIDLDATRAAIESLPWVARARVERQLPDTLHIAIDERAPFALWQHEGRYTLIDVTGQAITDVPGQYGDLPLIVGLGAPTRAARLFAEMAAVPELAARARAYVLVGERRWNIHFDSVEAGVAVRLPDRDVATALTWLASLERDFGILDRDLEFVDLRFKDRLVVRPRTGVDAVSNDGDPGQSQSHAPPRKKI